MARRVGARHIERRRIVVYRIHADIIEPHGAGDRNTPAAGAHIQDTSAVGQRHPRIKTCLNELADGRARNQYPRVHLKRQTGEPGLAGDVGQRLAPLNTPLKPSCQLCSLVHGERRGVNVGRNLEIKMQALHHQSMRFVCRVCRAVAEKYIGRSQTTRGEAHGVTDGANLRGQCRHVFR